MDMYNSLFSKNCVLNEQIALQIFDVLPDDGPIMAIMDRDGRLWSSDSERFGELAVGEVFLRELCAKIDDGAEPIISQSDDYSIIASQLATDETDCGYIILILPEHSPEATLANADVLQIVLNQASLIAKLIEKNNLLYERQVDSYRAYPQSVIASN